MRKAAEAHLAQMEGRYRALLEAAPHAMVVVNGAGEIVLLNARAEARFGYRRDELLGRPSCPPPGYFSNPSPSRVPSRSDQLGSVVSAGPTGRPEPPPNTAGTQIGKGTSPSKPP